VSESILSSSRPAGNAADQLIALHRDLGEVEALLRDALRRLSRLEVRQSRTEATVSAGAGGEEPLA
jgi:hypothetical protein